MSSPQNSPQDSNHAPGTVQPYWMAEAQDDEIDLFELWDIVWSGRWTIIICGVLAVALSVAYALMAEEIYEAKVVLMAADEESAGGGLASLAGQFGGLASLAGVNLGGGGGKAEEAKQVLSSFAFTARFIQDKKLLPVLFNESDRASNDEPPSLQDAVRKFDDEIRSISTDKTSGAVTLTMAWSDAQQAAIWANEMVVRLNQDMRDKDVTEAKRALEFLQDALQKTSVVEMQQTIYRLIESQTKTIMLANVRDDYVFTVIDPAYAPEKRAKPKRALIVVLGAMLGAMLGLLLVFFQRMVNSYKNRES